MGPLRNFGIEQDWAHKDFGCYRQDLGTYLVVALDSTDSDSHIDSRIDYHRLHFVLALGQHQ